MAYLDVTTRRDFGLYTLFVTPFEEAGRNFKHAFPCCCNLDSKDIPPLDRVIHFIVGVALAIPIINTITFVALRALLLQPIVSGPPIEIDNELDDSDLSEERRRKIDSYNENRNVLIQQLAAMDGDNPQRNKLYQNLITIERRAARWISWIPSNSVQKHLERSNTGSEDLLDMDGQIAWALPNETNRREISGDGLSKTVLKQVGGLTQGAAKNYLCGYYALFYMLQAAKGESFNNREFFAPILENWITLIGQRRIARWLASNQARDQSIPYGLKNIDVKGLTPNEMQYLIEKCEELAPLREKEGCFVFELDAYREAEAEEHILDPTTSSAITLLGKSKEQELYPKEFPIYAILKIGMHYYFTYTPRVGKFTFVHSLNYSIFNPSFFGQGAFREVLNALRGAQTPLRLKW